MGRAVSASSRRSVLALVALAGLLASLLVISSSTATSAAPVAARAGTANVGPMKATAGQWLTFSGKVPTGDKRPVIVQRLWAGKWVSPVRGSSNASGAYSIKVRMMAMPEEYFSVFAPKAGNRKAWRSKTFKIKNVMQEVRLNRSGNSFRANTSPDGAGRVVALQQRVSPGQWKTLETATTRAGGAAAFSHVPATDDGIYRAVARGWKGMGSYISFPLHLDSPDLVWKYVNDPGARGVLNPQPSSSWSAAAKYNWWPANEFWDMEHGQSLKPWTGYSTGSARINIFTGQLSIETSERPGGFGDASSTLQVAGFATGRWELRVRAPQFGAQYTPYKVRVSLVPAGTPDGVTPDKHIVLGEWTGYSSKTKIAISNGNKVLQRDLTGHKRNRNNWHNLAIEIKPKKITWVIDRKVVGQSGGKPTQGTKWVPRIEMIGAQGKAMTRTKGGIDWVRYFTLDRRRAVTLPAGPVLK